MDSFVYCWTDHKTNKLYVGSHKGTLDDGYICSSKIMLEEYNQRPQDFTRQIIAHGTYGDCRKFESAILVSCNVVLNEKFYNQSTGNGKFHTANKHPWNKGLTKEDPRVAHNLRNWTTKGKKLPQPAIEKKSKWMLENNPFRGKKHTKETKEKFKYRPSGVKGTKWFNNGEINIRRKQCPEGFVEGRM